MKKLHRKFLISYSLLFILIFLVTASWLIAHGRSLVLGGDPVSQHLRALIYYSRYLRALPGYVLREHALPGYSLSIGLGSDVLTTLHFYVIGDPLNLLSAFVPTSCMAIFYSAMIAVRMYLAGLAFAFMQRTLTHGGAGREGGILAGALIYVFCAFSVYGGWRHPFFLNPMICFPLIIAGAERMRLGKGRLLLIFSVALSAVSNFYFFYMIAACTVAWALWKCAAVYGRELKKSLAFLLRMAGASLLGVMISGAVLLPVLFAFAGNPRSVQGYIFDALYDPGYYVRFPVSVITFWAAEDWGYIGVASVAVLALLALVIRRRRKDLQILFVIVTAGLMIPWVSYAMNGFAYVVQRWIWAYVLLIASMTAQGWDLLAGFARGAARGAGKRDRWIFAGAALAIAALLAGLSRAGECAGSRQNLYVQLALMGAAVLILLTCRQRRAMAGVFACLVLGVCCNGLFGIVPQLGGVGNGYYAWNRVAGDDAEIFNTEAAAIRAIEGGDTFSRYSGKDLSVNASVQDGVPSTQFYWSLANGAVSRFFETFGLCSSYANAFAHFDGRTILNEISGVKTFYTQKERYVPYGYDLLEGDDNPRSGSVPLYRNRFTLPFGIFYDRVITETAFEELDQGARQETLLRFAVAEDAGAEREALPASGAAEASEGLTRTVPAITLEAEEESALIEGNTITASQDGARIRIRFEGTGQSETGLYLKGISYRSASGSQTDIPARLTFKVRGYAGRKKAGSASVTWFTRREKWYAGRNTFFLHAGWHEEKLSSFVLTLPTAGVYTFEEISVHTQPFGEAYESLAAELGSRTIENVNLHTGADTLTWATGRMDFDFEAVSDGLLCLQMAFSPGWQAKVDGKRVSPIRTNLMYTGIPLQKGAHRIELVYRTRGLLAGTLLTLAGLLAALLPEAGRRRRAKRRQRRDPAQERDSKNQQSAQDNRAFMKGETHGEDFT